ncbi:MAG: ArsR family transcriptional regulator [Deltaproteobacteria bacterium]|nr:MAG: ArsR family transcriptional regulator [Deltaproteobacteria bacterium]
MELHRIYKALADENRLRLLRVIANGPYSVAELQAIMQMGQSRVSRHLKILVEAGLARVERQGTWSYYRAAGNGNEAARLQIDLLLRADLAGAAADEARRQECLERRRARAREFHQRVAPTWNKMRRELLGDGRAIQAVLEAVAGRPVVADLGCGAGKLLEELCRRAERAIGVDASPAMLEQARRALDGHAGCERVDLRLGQLEHLPLCDGEAQAVVMMLVLHHVAEPPLALREVRRVLAPGGVLVVCDLCRHDHEWMRTEYGDQWLGFADEQARQLLGEAGFEDTRLEHYQTPRVQLFLATARAPGRTS